LSAAVSSCLLSTALLVSITMAVITGSFKLVSTSNMAAAFAVMGIPDDAIKSFLDPKNEIVYDCIETSPGCFEVKTTNSLMPTWNQHFTVKLGETLEITAPIPYKMTMTKKNDFTYASRVEMNGRVILGEQVVHNYGMTINRNIEGTDICYSEVLKRVTPKLNGYYMFESESGLAGVIKALGLPTDNMDLFSVGSAFRVKETGDCMEVIEYFGGNKKLVNFKYNEEFDYDRPEFNMSEKRVVTKVGPASAKVVCKSKKTGKVWDYTMCFTDRGCVIKTCVDGAECTEHYKRGCDMEGSWRTVACTGAEAHGAALGMSGAVLEGYLEQHLKETFCCERLPGGAIQIKSASPWLPSGVMVVKSGEEFTLDIPGMGKSTGLGHEGCDEWIQASKMGGKVVSQHEKITGDFMISETCVDGIKSTTQITIMTRD